MTGALIEIENTTQGIAGVQDPVRHLLGGLILQTGGANGPENVGETTLLSGETLSG